MSEVLHDWDGWLNRLIDDEAARSVSDIRAYLITEIRRAMSEDAALPLADADRLAEIAVDTMIESTRKMQIRKS